MHLPSLLIGTYLAGVVITGLLLRGVAQDPAFDGYPPWVVQLAAFAVALLWPITLTVFSARDK